MIGGRGGLAYLVRPDDVISGQPLTYRWESGDVVSVVGLILEIGAVDVNVEGADRSSASAAVEHIRFRKVLVFSKQH